MKTESSSPYWIAKFGGTSVATYEAMTRCARIIAHSPQTKIVVVSAPAGITNLLVKLSQPSMHGSELLTACSEIKNKIHAILNALSSSTPTSLREEVKNILENIVHLAQQLNSDYSRQRVDELLASGEKMSARLFTCVLYEQGLPAVYQDAREIIKTDDHFGKAEVLIKETAIQAKKILLPQCREHILVTEGFIGSTQDHITTTLGRGGSDYSAALLAEAIHAEVLQIWTDVPGIYTVDPRLVPHAKPIDTLCFTEAAELAQFGAKILHPATLWPAIRKNIPVFVGSSLDALAAGTWIRAHSPEQMKAPLIRAISLRKRQILLTIHSLEMLHTHGFLAKIFSILAQHKLSVDLVTTSEVSVALTLNPSENEADILLTPQILAELQAIGNVSLTIDKELSLIALIGNHLHKTPGVSGRIFNKLSAFNIRLICHGASPHNLCFLVNENEAHTIIQAMHAEFFEV